MTEQELLHTALVIPPKARKVLCLWAAVPGALFAPFWFWQGWARGLGFCLLWAGLVFALWARSCSFTAALTPGHLRVQLGVAFPVLRQVPRRAVTGVLLLRTPLLWLAGASILVVRSPGGALVLPGVPSVQADALAVILSEGAV